MKKPLVSLIIPFYNSGKHIARCIESLINQDYSNLEIIFINDGGVDNSVAIIQSYMRKDSRIVLIDKKHSGVSSTRNLGLKACKGDFVQFIDSDDYVEYNMISVMIDKALKYNADLVICNYTHPSIKNYLGDCILNMKNKRDLLRYCQTTFAMVVPWNKLYKKEVITDYFDESVHFCEDDLFALSNLSKIKNVVSISDVLYHYYIEPASTSIQESSCINKMAKANDFWITKNTYWYKRKDLLKKSLDKLSTFLNKDLAAECAYARIFDFMIWEILIMNQIGALRQGIIYEVKNIFNEPEFIKSINLRKKYGLRMKKFSPLEYNIKIEEFCNKCFQISSLSMENEKLRAFYLCLEEFVSIFMEQSGEINSIDIMTRSFLCYKNKMNSQISFTPCSFYSADVADPNFVDN